MKAYLHLLRIAEFMGEVLVLSQAIENFELNTKDEEVTTKQGIKSSGRKKIPIESLTPSRYQVRDRAFFNREDLVGLAESIRSIGLLQLPRVRVYPEDPTYFEIISGHRRIRAASEVLGWKEIECEIFDCQNEFLASQLCFDDNMQRCNLSPYEEGIAFLLIEKTFGLSQEQIAQRFHRSKVTVQSRRQLALSANVYLKYIEPERANLFLRHASLAHLAALSGLDQNSVKEGIKMISRGATVRNLERFARLFGSGESKVATTRIYERYLGAENSDDSAENQILQSINQLIEESPSQIKARLEAIRKNLEKITKFSNSTRLSESKIVLCPKCGATL